MEVALAAVVEWRIGGWMIGRTVSGMAVRARMGMEGRYLAMRRGVVPVSVSTTIILASTSKAVLTAGTHRRGNGRGGQEWGSRGMVRYFCDTTWAMTRK
jgi:hypothetical protein